MFEHRYVWELFNGPIKPGFEIHHIDGNQQNNLIENLECVHESEHHSRDRKVRIAMTEFLKDKGLWEEFKRTI